MIYKPDFNNYLRKDEKMDQISIENLSTEEINDLLGRLQSEKSDRRDIEKLELIDDIKRKAEILDIPLEEIAEELMKGKKRKKSKVMPKYKNPHNENETWTGRGRAPQWMQKLLDQGRNKEEFLIQ